MMYGQNLTYDKIFTPYTYLRRPDIEYTMNEDEKLEYKKCENDPVYFIENICELPYYHGMSSNINLSSDQKMLITSNDDMTAIVERQAGVTTALVFKVLYNIIFKNKRYAIYGKNAATDKFMSQFKKAYHNLPFYIQKGVTKCSAKIFKTEGGGSLNVITKSSCRGLTIDELIVAANTMKISDVKTSCPWIYSDLLPVIKSIGGHMTIIDNISNESKYKGQKYQIIHKQF